MVTSEFLSGTHSDGGFSSLGAILSPVELLLLWEGNLCYLGLIDKPSYGRHNVGRKKKFFNNGVFYSKKNVFLLFLFFKNSVLIL